MKPSQWAALTALMSAAPALAGQLFVPYPAGAAARGEHGSTVVAITINSAGQVANCVVSRSSGSAELDAATCALVGKGKRYARVPAGEPLRIDTGRINWMIPGTAQRVSDLPIDRRAYEVILDRDRPIGPDGKMPRVFLSSLQAPLPRQFQPGFESVRIITAVKVSPQLRPVACSVEVGSGYPNLDEQVCKDVLQTATFWVEPSGTRPRKTPDPSLPAIVLVPVDYTLAGSGKSLMQAEHGTFNSASPIQHWSWITGDDYPPEAVKHVAEGVVTTEIYSAGGRALHCDVVESSGDKDLDDATCRIVLKRGIFTQAHDVDGRPLLGVSTDRMSWVMPDDAFPAGHVRLDRLPPSDMDLTLPRLPLGLTSSVIALRYLVDEKGKVVSCEADYSSGVPALDAAACKATTMGDQGFTVVRDGKGTALRTVRTKRIGITVQQ
ncbi:MAG: TonB family protein [Sphingomonas sp.]|nr:TonB family protein [Sphingomonas sp.]